MTNSIPKFENTWNGWAQIGPSSLPHLPLLSGLHHPGGAHTRDLRIGKNGINTAGRMTGGQTRGDRQALTCGVKPGLRKLKVFDFEKTS